MFLPGVEIFGIAGIILLVVSAVLAILFVPGGWLIVAGQGVIVAGFVFYMMRFMRQKQLQGKLIMNEALAEDVPEFVDLTQFMGKEGRTLTALRPQGEADFNGVRLPVSSNGPMMDTGTKIRVVDTRGHKIVVSAVEEQ
jgi:membrane-bound ClpP family serine protease